MIQDPNILYSMVNMKLRDSFSSLEELCESEGWNLLEVVEILEEAGFYYDEEQNQFRAS